MNIYFIILIGLGPIALYFYSENMYLSGNYQNVIQMVLIGYVCINLGYFLASKQTRNVFTNKTYLSPPGGYSSSFKSKLRISAYVFFTIGILASLLFFARTGNIPILAANKEAARVAALAVGGNGYVLYLMSMGMYGVALYAIYAYGYNKDKTQLFLLFAIMGLAMTGTGSRRYILWVCLYLLIAKHYLSSPIPKTRMLVYTFLGLLFVNLFEMFRNPDSMTTTSLSTTFSYRFIIYISNLEKVLTYFMSRDEYEYGGTFFMDILTALPGKQIDYQSWLKKVTNLEFEGFGIPPTLMGDLYVNFGYVGVVLGCTLFGFMVRNIYNSLILKRGSFYNLFLYMAVLEISSKIITSGISAQAISILWLAIFVGLYKVLFKHLALFGGYRNAIN
nr:oligosaccharide repeat unit polymerase [Dyadobacter fermentans]